MIKERERYQRLVNQELAKPKERQQQELINYYEARQLALKLLANASYEAFAKTEFAYSGYRVSEIITGFGRLIHKQMEKMGFERYGFQTVLGFTDSIFIQTSWYCFCCICEYHNNRSLQTRTHCSFS